MSDNNSVIDALKNRRSIRKFTDKPVSKEKITAILEAGRWAPSGCNRQPWRFLVIHKDDHRADALAECTKYSKILNSAEVLICVFLKKEQMYSEQKDHQGAGACIQNMLLAAHSFGIGTVWIGEILDQNEQVLELLGLSAEEYEFQAVIAAGYPAQKGGSKRIELLDLMLEEY